MPAKVSRTPPKVLMIGAHQLVLDNVRVLLGTMGCLCVVGSNVKEVRALLEREKPDADRKSTRLNSSHGYISYAVFCLKKKNKSPVHQRAANTPTNSSRRTNRRV